MVLSWTNQNNRFLRRLGYLRTIKSNDHPQPFDWNSSCRLLEGHAQPFHFSCRFQAHNFRTPTFFERYHINMSDSRSKRTRGDDSVTSVVSTSSLYNSRPWLKCIIEAFDDMDMVSGPWLGRCCFHLCCFHLFF